MSTLVRHLFARDLEQAANFVELLAQLVAAYHTLAVHSCVLMSVLACSLDEGQTMGPPLSS